MKNCPCGGHSKESCTCSSFQEEPICVVLPTIVKAYIDKGGSRLIEFEASNECEDSEGDIILQKALLDSAQEFLMKGHLDLDHLTELCKLPQYWWLGIKDPKEFLVGYPTKVWDMGEGKTGIQATLLSNPNVSKSSIKPRYETVWEEIQHGIEYKASIYGFPGRDTLERGCGLNASGNEVCATRYLVKSIRWSSTALTKNPINKSIGKSVQIITAKSFLTQDQLEEYLPIKTNVYDRQGLLWAYDSHICKCCPHTENGWNINTLTIRDHFICCDKVDANLADVYSLALVELLRRRVI